MTDRHPALIALDNATVYNRASVLWELFDRSDVMPRRDWFAEFGRQWHRCSNNFFYREKFAGIINSATRDELNLMMSAEERAQWKALPRLINVYRGCTQHTARGLSWTLLPRVAELFASIYAGGTAHGDTPLVLTGYVHKARVIFKNPLGHQEIIATKVSITSRKVYAGAPFEKVLSRVCVGENP